MAYLNEFNLGKRINVCGTTGMGKTTLASRLGETLGIKHVELDFVYWGENWSHPQMEGFRKDVRKALQDDAWIVDGNYSKSRDIVWENVETVIFLDYAKIIPMWRVTVRSLHRIITRERVWGKNVETFDGAFLSKNSLFRWLMSTYDRRRKQFHEFMESEKYRHINFVCFKNPKETDKWFEELKQIYRRKSE
jgi:adenylate kinase family enzyme